MSIWSKAADLLGGAAPLIGGLLLGPAGAAAGTLVSSALGVENTPEAVAAELQQNPDAILKIKELESRERVQLEQLTLQAETRQHEEINKTMRVEAAANDAYVRRWRPTWGYAMAASWLLLVFGLVATVFWSVVEHPTQAAQIITTLGTFVSLLMPLFGIALAVLGVNVSKRSQDKQVAAGQAPPPGVLGALAQRILPGGKA